MKLIDLGGYVAMWRRLSEADLRILIPPFPGSNPGAPARFPTSFHCLDRSIVALTILISKVIPRFISKFRSCGVR